MKNANVFVDVDLTLVDANGKLLEGAQEASWPAMARRIIEKHVDK